MSLDLDRLKQALFGLINTVMKRVDYFALYPAKVVKQASNGTLELQPEDVRFEALLPGLTSVPIRYGVPGIKATVAVGGRVLLGFEGGSPQAPIAELWDTSAVTRLDIEADKVFIGAPTGTQAAVLGQTLQTHLSAIEVYLNQLAVFDGLMTAWAALVHTFLTTTFGPAFSPTAVPVPPPPPPGIAPVTPDVKATNVEVK